MKASVRHLPKNKQFELNQIKRVMLEFCPDIEMIILFGSYARGDWVEDTYQEGHITYEYQSDYDLLLVFKDDKPSSSIPFGLKLGKRIKALNIETRVSLILHSIKFVNKKITRGNYFFTDIKKEGIKLYDSGNYKLSRRKKLNPFERQKYAQEDFDYWFSSASEFKWTFEQLLNRGSYNLAAFQLHQATEQFYHTILLVFTDYKPKTHDIEGLSNKAKNLNIEFGKVFPRTNDEEDRLFNLLKRAYVDARYEPDYSIQKEELEYLGQRVAILKELTEWICKEKIAGFVD